MARHHTRRRACGSSGCAPAPTLPKFAPRLAPPPSFPLKRRSVLGPDMRQRRRSILPRLVLLFLLAGGTVLAFRQGLIPARYSPLPALDLADPSGYLLDWRLAELRREPELCRRVLTAPHIEAAPVADKPLAKGCGWTNSVRLASVGGSKAPVDTLTCEAAAALALWMAHEVQPLARTLLGEPVAAVQHMGTYACRNIVGNPLWREMRSEHATANAIDISGFVLASGRQVSVLKEWSGASKQAAFLRAIHQRACRYFRVAIGPEFNVSHKDHFHYDRGFLSRCR
jgi:hypothetical protein